MQLHSKTNRDKAMKDYVETFDLIDDETGEPWRPEPLPPDPRSDPAASGGGAPVTDLVTASWRVMAERHAAGDRSVVPVRISLGLPKFWPLAAGFPYVHELAPAGLHGRDLPHDEFANLYVERLDHIGPERIARRLDAVHDEYGRSLALCCFEASPADCHRGRLAWWWEQRTGQSIPELSPRFDQLRIEPEGDR